MKEELLYYIWKYKLFPVNQFKTVDGEPIEIINPGEYNHNAGPDFINARLMIDRTIWAGNVEIHVSSGDWVKHKHDGNSDYENVILQVVYSLKSVF
jgi:hypothetical protein